MKVELAKKTQENLTKALNHLEYSLKKARVTLKKPGLSEDDLEALEGFAARFARASDIAIQQYLRLRTLEKDPAFRGGVIDVLNQAEKFGWIASATEWTKIRELRNVTAHEYSDQEILELYAELVRLSDEVLKVRELLKSGA